MINEISFHSIYLLTYLVCLVGGSWVAIFRHKASEGLFKVIDGNSGLLEFEPNGNGNGQEAFSRLEQIHKYQFNGMYHFKMCYSATTGSRLCNEWKQSSNPVDSDQVSDFTTVNLDDEEFQANSF